MRSLTRTRTGRLARLAAIAAWLLLVGCSGKPLGPSLLCDSRVNSDEIDPSSTVNVRAYGAIGDGTTDDTAAIQSAIDALPDSQGTAYFPAGQYLVSHTLVIPAGKRVTLKGDGSQADGQSFKTLGASTILYSGSGPAIDASGVESTTFVSLLMFDLDLVGRGATGDGIRLNSARTCLFERMRVAEFAQGAGFHITGGDSQDLVFSNVIAESNAYGLLAAREMGQRYGWTQIVVQSGSQFQYNHLGNIWASEGSSLYIRDSYLNAGADETIWLRISGVFNFVVSNIHAELGFPSSSGDSILVEGSTGEGHEETLSGLITGSTLVRSNQKSGNGVPIRIDHSRSITIAGNQFNTPSNLSPIAIGGAAKDIELGNNYWTYADLKLAEIDPAAQGIRVTFLDIIPFDFEIEPGVVHGPRLLSTISKGLPGYRLPKNSWVVQMHVSLVESPYGALSFQPLLDGIPAALSLALSDSPFGTVEQPPLLDANRISAGGELTLSVSSPTGACVPAGTASVWMGVNGNATNPM